MEANNGNQSLVALISIGVVCVTFAGILTFQVIIRLKQLRCTCITNCRGDHLHQPMTNVEFHVPEEEPPQEVEPLRLTFDESGEFVLVHAEN